ncbi:hypothetical protein CFC21_038939 [Triticum aestivum]|uniref:Uncharacterized protein n=2 Tax=Triticum aestivum TaxID=4565 RepID=A0A3B6UBP5_WHEAT|nr:hypothetical protein CFC21_038939 [Triticum aestivum]
MDDQDSSSAGGSSRSSAGEHEAEAADQSPPPRAALLAQSPARAGKKCKKRQGRMFLAGMKSTSSPAGGSSSSSAGEPEGEAAEQSPPPRAALLAQSPARAGKKSKKLHGRAFLAGMESTSSPAGGSSSSSEGEHEAEAADQSPPPGAALLAQSPARAGKKGKKLHGGAFLDSTGAIWLERRAVPLSRSTSSSMAAGASKTKKRKTGKQLPDRLFWYGMKSTSAAAAAGPGPADLSLESIRIVGAGLDEILKSLNASAPVRIYGKLLSKSDRLLDQSRLLMSCKKWKQHGLDDVLTVEEKQLIEKQIKVDMKAYDRDGNSYDLACKKLDCNGAYRLIAGWGKFLKANNLHVEPKAKPEELEPAMVELWAFRSPALELGVVTDHPDGPLGLVVVHYLHRDAPHAQAAINEIRASLPGGAVAAVDAPHDDDDAVAAIEADGCGEAVDAPAEADAE